MKNEIIVEKIIGYSKKVIKYCENLSSQNDFLLNSMLLESCVFNLIQIGESVSKLDDIFMDAHPEIPWRALYGLRNRIVHDYEGVNFDLVWDIIKDDLPDLINKLKNIKN